MSDFINTLDVIGDDALVDSIINRNITEYADNQITKIGKYAFSNCNNLVSIKCPAVTNLSEWALSNCTSLEIADFSALISIGRYCFNLDSKLVALIIRTGTVAYLSGAMSYSGIAQKTGYIYVPAALVDSYKVASNWKTYATQFRALEDYTIDGTITGELDETKT